MIKTLKMQSGLHTIDTEEMLLTFEDMIYKFAHNCIKSLQAIEGNIYEFDDYVQLGRLEAITAFKSYDVNTGVMFSTYLTNALRYVHIHLMRDMNAKKRKADKPLVYINKEIESGVDGSNVIADKDSHNYFKVEKCDLEDYLVKNLTEEDVLFLTMDLKKKVGKSKGCYRESLCYTLDVLKDKGVELEDVTKGQLALKLGISRPTLNKKIESTLEKTQKLVKDYLRKTGGDYPNEG